MENYNGPLNKCVGCGNCCKVIPVNIPMEKFKELYLSEDKESEYYKDIKFIVENWIPIYNYIDIWRLQPDISIFNTHYYICKQFDNFAHKCKVYNNRPPICMNYPYYRKDNHVGLIYDKCIFGKND